MSARWLLGLASAGALGAGLGCAALIGLSSPVATTFCVNTADQAVLGHLQNDFVSILLGCALTNADEPAACVQAKSMVSAPCAGCGAQTGVCAGNACSKECVGGADSIACQQCVSSTCNTVLLACAGMPVYGCLGAGDQAALTKHGTTVLADLQQCAGENEANPDGVVACLEQMDGLSEDCATCYALEDLCVISQCSMCVADPTTTMCQDCANTNCVPAFVLCSGLPDGGPS